MKIEVLLGAGTAGSLLTGKIQKLENGLVAVEILKIYGTEVICIDSTHGTNKYNIQLTSLLVKDDNWEGFPVAFLWSNIQHESVFTCFFEKIKERIEDIKTNTFMSDDYKAFFNAWCAIFSEPTFYLLCDWHVKRALKKSDIWLYKNKK